MELSKIVVLSSKREIYKDIKGFFINNGDEVWRIQESTTTNKLKDTGQEDKICPICGKTSEYFTEGTCDECWFIEQTKLKGGQYL